jgi:hypothetical protein
MEYNFSGIQTNQERDILPVSDRATPACPANGIDQTLYLSRIFRILFPIIEFSGKYLTNFLKRRIKAKITSPAPAIGTNPGQGYREIPAYPAAPGLCRIRSREHQCASCSVLVADHRPGLLVDVEKGPQYSDRSGPENSGSSGRHRRDIPVTRPSGVDLRIRND